MASLQRTLLAAAYLSFAAVALGRAETNTCSAGYITDEVRGEETINQYGSHFQAVNIFAFQFNGQCQIEAKSPWVEEVSRGLRDDPNRLILIDVVNEINLTSGPCRNLSPGQVLQTIFSDPVKRAAHIRDIVAISALGQGVEMDYEHVLSSTTALYTQFMQELRAALPAEKKLAAVVQPKTQGGGEQGTTVNWRGIEPYVDYLRVMAYYYSYNTSVPGPVITYAKLGQLADYILNSPTQSIPRSKARILLSLYGWDWPVSPSAPGRLIRFEEAMEIARDHGITPERDPVQDTLKFQYSDSSGTVHEVWVEDVVGQQKRVQLLLDRDFPAIDLWHLNTGDPDLWQWFTPLVRSDCPSLAAPPAVPAVARLNELLPAAIKLPGIDTVVTIRGTGFTSTDMVLFAGNPYVPFAITSSSMQVAVPTAVLQKPGARRMTVVQNGRISNPLDFFVVGNPVITSFDPPQAVIGTPFTLAVRGNGFEPGSIVRWNGRDMSTQFVNDKELRITVGAELVTQTATLSVGVINPTSGARVSRSYTINSGPSQAALPNGFQVGPNPWTVGKNSGGIRFFGTDSDVRIFTVSGHMVRKVTPTSGVAEWDLTNEDGENVAAGLYLYHTGAADGSKKRGTLVVIR